MEWGANQPDTPVSSDQYFGCDYEAYQNSSLHPNNQNANNYMYPGHEYQGNFYSSSQDGNFYDHRPQNYQQSYHYSNYAEDAEKLYQAPMVPLPTTARVHVNPNYKPKLCNTICPRPKNVYINPHWKGRTETVSITEQNDRAMNCSNEGAKKNTIFVNPKILAHIKVDSTAQPVIPYSEKDAQALAGEVVEASSMPCTTSSTISTSKMSTDKEYAQPHSTNESTFIVLSSTKLVRNSNPKLSKTSELVAPKPQPSFSTSKVIGIGKKTSSTPIIKVAKQVCTKYKLVRNSSSPYTKGVPANTIKRSRRKSLSSRTSINPRLNSIYKFVRKTSVPQLHLKNDDEGTSASELISQANQTPPLKGTSRKSIKTRYRLVRSLQQKDNVPLSETKKLKTIQTRFKLVRKNSLESKSPFRKLVPAYRQVSAQQSFVRNLSHSKSRFKVTRNLNEGKVIHARKVSRFQVSTFASIKPRTKYTQNIWKLHRNNYGSSLLKLSSQKPHSYGNIIWRKEKNLRSYTSKGNHCEPFSLSINNGTRKSSNKRLLNISGVLYRSTRTTLTRSHPGKPKERVVSIRGKRFVLDGKGMTLRPTTDNDESTSPKLEHKKGLSIARVDLGGVTFTRRSDNTLVRTNTHHARNLLSIAKTRSIAMLTDKLRKNNQPCLIYHRFGKCHAQEEGKCWRVHDPKNVSVCRKFLQGTCEAEKCLLSHDVGPEKMPTCRYFLEGCCVRDNCPYLHVKLNAHAAICRQFLHGYCEAGDMCKKRHVNLCPDFEQGGKCSKGKYCPFPHHKRNEKKKSKRGLQDNTTAQSKSKGKKHEEDACPGMAAVPSGEVEKRIRYYDESTAAGGQCTTQTECSVDEVDEETVEGQIIQGRPKIGLLPAFIPLD